MVLPKKGLHTLNSMVLDLSPLWQPYVRTNYWFDLDGNSSEVFGIDAIPLVSHSVYGCERLFLHQD